MRPTQPYKYREKRLRMIELRISIASCTIETPSKSRYCFYYMYITGRAHDDQNFLKLGYGQTTTGSILVVCAWNMKPIQAVEPSESALSSEK